MFLTKKVVVETPGELFPPEFPFHLKPVKYLCYNIIIKHHINMLIKIVMNRNFVRKNHKVHYIVFSFIVGLVFFSHAQSNLIVWRRLGKIILHEQFVLFNLWVVRRKKNYKNDQCPFRNLQAPFPDRKSLTNFSVYLYFFKSSRKRRQSKT